MKLTIYTPTYNRAYRLPHLYKSLLRQTNKNFKWLVLDDGSTDDTSELVKKWIDERKINIKYVYHANIGKQATVNVAHALIDTVLNTCVDSDDFLLDNAVEIILNEWYKIDSTEIAGIVGLDVYKDGSIVGSKFPDNIDILCFSDFKKNNIYGDKKFVYKTEIIKKYKYPQIKKEKFPAPGYIYRLIDINYKLKLINEALCVVEYLDDGISSNKFNQLRNNPNSFIFYRKERIKLARDNKDLLKNYFHLVYTCFYAKVNPFKVNTSKTLTLLVFPFSVIFYIYLELTNKKGVV
ncbi:glycosyltransferase family 2 protein [Flavobacterium sp. CS20]|uniref:glycosyltransferase family 2 protein n=1 Tax=Flavobacterium sp. CS20 TaxID=2775246 RepID=UPI001B39DA17|nr:glycosyltransferase family 2 protein [Flavobacterium sp. CS20]QTY26670.1 glycosyltransferase family 2 protein [Flavobacterium sp. CS20]